MRKYLIFICTVLLASCLNNDFLERYPLGDPTAETAFETYDNFKAYAWGCVKPAFIGLWLGKFYGRHLVQPDKRNQRKQLDQKTGDHPRQERQYFLELLQLYPKGQPDARPH